MLYTDLFLALQERNWDTVRWVFLNQQVKVFCPGEGDLVRDMKYGRDGDLAEFFLHNYLSVNRLREILYIVDGYKKLAESDKISNLEIVYREVEEEISKVENKILTLMGIYAGALLTFTLSDHGILMFFAASTALFSTVYCKHANTPCDFVDNIKSALYDKLIEPICANKLHARIHDASSEKNNTIPSL